MILGGTIFALALAFGSRPDFFDKRNLNDITALCLLLCASFLGLLLTKLLYGSVPQPWQDPHRFTTWNGTASDLYVRLGLIPQRLIELLDLVPQYGSEVFSFEVLEKTSRALLFFILIFTPFLGHSYPEKSAHKSKFYRSTNICF